MRQSRGWVRFVSRGLSQGGCRLRGRSTHSVKCEIIAALWPVLLSFQKDCRGTVGLTIPCVNILSLIPCVTSSQSQVLVLVLAKLLLLLLLLRLRLLLLLLLLLRLLLLRLLRLLLVHNSIILLVLRHTHFGPAAICHIRRAIACIALRLPRQPRRTPWASVVLHHQAARCAGVITVSAAASCSSQRQPAATSSQAAPVASSQQPAARSQVQPAASCSPQPGAASSQVQPAAGAASSQQPVASSQRPGGEAQEVRFAAGAAGGAKGRGAPTMPAVRPTHAVVAVVSVVGGKQQQWLSSQQQWQL